MGVLPTVSRFGSACLSYHSFPELTFAAPAKKAVRPPPDHSLGVPPTFSRFGRACLSLGALPALSPPFKFGTRHNLSRFFKREGLPRPPCHGTRREGLPVSRFDGACPSRFGRACLSLFRSACLSVGVLASRVHNQGSWCGRKCRGIRELNVRARRGVVARARSGERVREAWRVEERMRADWARVLFVGHAPVMAPL